MGGAPAGRRPRGRWRGPLGSGGSVEWRFQLATRKGRVPEGKRARLGARWEPGGPSGLDADHSLILLELRRWPPHSLRREEA